MIQVTYSASYSVSQSQVYQQATASNAHQANPQPSETGAGKAADGSAAARQKDDNSAISNVERQDPATTASNILDFVARGVEQLQASGASEERIQQRLDAARAGIEKGYAQATQMLDDLGMLDEQLTSDIASSRAMVDQTLQQWSERGETGPVAADQSSAVEQIREQTRTSLLNGSQMPERPDSDHGRRQLASHNELAMEVTTRDGDRVTVFFSDSRASAEHWSDGRYGFAMSSDQQFDFRVDGELDESELEALNGLFKQAESLSNQFFSGDLGGAVESALAIGYDRSELAAFSLDLRQSSLSRQTHVYEQAPQAPTAELQSLRAPLANYTDQYFNALQQDNPLGNNADLIDSMIEQLVGEEDSRLQAFRSLNDGLQARMADLTQASQA